MALNNKGLKPSERAGSIFTMEVRDLFDVDIITDCMGEPPHLYTVYALGERPESGAGLRGFYMTPWFKSTLELEAFCAKHIDKFRAAAVESKAPAPDATCWELPTAQQHTPLPWKVQYNEPKAKRQSPLLVVDGDDLPIAAIRNRGDVDVEIANAELVVRAANSYAKLLRELQNLVDAVDNDLLPKGDFPGVPSAVARAKNAIRDAKTLPTAPEPKANTGR